MAKDTLNPTPAQIRAIFRNSMSYEILFTFGVPRHDPYDYCHWETVNFTRMAHARILYDFLEGTKENRNKDDVVAEDFGFCARSIALPADDRDRLNKDLFHLSFSRLRHTPESKRWPSSILSNLLAPTLEFMKFISDCRKDLFDSSTDLNDWDKLTEMLSSGCVLQIKSVAEIDGRPLYELSLGPPLPQGKPVLSQHLGTVQ